MLDYKYRIQSLPIAHLRTDISDAAHIALESGDEKAALSYTEEIEILESFLHLAQKYQHLAADHRVEQVQYVVKFYVHYEYGGKTLVQEEYETPEEVQSRSRYIREAVFAEPRENEEGHFWQRSKNIAGGHFSQYVCGYVGIFEQIIVEHQLVEE